MNAGDRRAAKLDSYGDGRQCCPAGRSATVVVGTVLIVINHGDAILAGHLDGPRVLKMALTVLVPYCVSTASSVGAMLERPARENRR